MEPSSITAAVASLAFSIVKNGRALVILYDKFHSAQHTIFMIQTECTVMAAAISQLEVSVSGRRAVRLANCPRSVVEALDLSLTGCTLTLSALEKEIKRLTTDATHANMKVRMFDRTRFLWKEENMNELLQQLRGQSSAMSLLLRALDTTSMEESLGIVQAGQPTFRKVRSGADSIRKMYPKEKYAKSILEMPFDDSKTIYSLETASIAGITVGSSYKNDGSTAAGSSLGATTLNARSDSSPDVDGLPRGWQKAYSNEYGQWYYINNATRKSQWDHPLELPKPPGPPPTETFVQPPRPVSSPSGSKIEQQPRGPSTSSPSVDNNTTALAKLEVTSTTDSSISTDIDLTPWLLNTVTKLEKALDGSRKEYKAPGLAVGIVSLDEPPEFFISGTRKAEVQVPVAKTDKFVLSQNDVMTFAVVTILVERGVLSWEDKIVNLLPAIAPRIHPFHHDTTLAMFCSSNSGIEHSVWTAENGDLLRYLSSTSTEPKAGRMAMALFYLVRPPDSTPGTKYYRSPINAVLVGLAMEEVTKQPFETLIKTMLFDPLEMYSAGIGWPDMERNTATNPTQPWPHNGTTKQAGAITAGKELNITSMLPWFGVHCSITDYAAFAKFQLQWALGIDPLGIVSEATLKKWKEKASNEDLVYTRGGYQNADREWAKGPALMVTENGYGVSNSIWIGVKLKKAFVGMTNLDTVSAGQKLMDDATFAAYRYDRDKGQRMSVA